MILVAMMVAGAEVLMGLHGHESKKTGLTGRTTPAGLLHPGAEALRDKATRRAPQELRQPF
jgi:hypothetical protein